MNRKLLELTITHYLCPYCGKWHEWPLEDYEEKSLNECYADLVCGQDHRTYHVDYDEMKHELNYSTTQNCSWSHLKLDDYISVDDIIESDDEPIVTFEVPFTSKNVINEHECRNCSFRDCQLKKLGEAGDGKNMKIKLGFKFDKAEYFSIHRQSSKAMQQKEK